MLLCFHDLVAPGQIVGNIYIWESEALNHLLFNAIDTDEEGVYTTLLQEVNDQLLNFTVIEGLLSSHNATN